MTNDLPEGTRPLLERALGRRLPAEGGKRSSFEALTEDDLADLRLLRSWPVGAVCYVRFRVAGASLQHAKMFCEAVINQGLPKDAALRYLEGFR